MDALLGCSVCSSERMLSWDELGGITESREVQYLYGGEICPSVPGAAFIRRARKGPVSRTTHGWRGPSEYLALWLKRWVLCSYCSSKAYGFFTFQESTHTDKLFTLSTCQMRKCKWVPQKMCRSLEKNYGYTGYYSDFFLFLFVTVRHKKIAIS